MSVTQVQRWVSSVLVATLIEHFAAGLILAAIFIDHSDLAARIGLNVLATLASALAVVAVRAIHGRKPLSAWPALGLLVGGVGFYLTFRL